MWSKSVEGLEAIKSQNDELQELYQATYRHDKKNMLTQLYVTMVCYIIFNLIAER